MDRVTVYRVLLNFADAGILVRTHLGDNVQRYGLPRTRGLDHGLHPHLVCTECGAVQCLAEEAVVLRGEAAKFAIVDVQLRGLCAECQETASRT
jgi:Fur family ferric uptake transcriptional regulator